MKNIQAFYINMPTATDRRIKFEQVCKSLNLPFAINRFEAVTPNNYNGSISKSEIGCFLSHMNVLDICHNESNVFIFEDDAILTNAFYRMLPLLSDLKSYDIVFLNAGMSPFNPDKLLQLINLKSNYDLYCENFTSFNIFDSKELYLHGASAYMLTPSGLLKLRHLYSQETLSNEINIPLDLFLKNIIHQGNLNGVVIFPFLTGIDQYLPTQMTHRIANNQAEVNDACSNLFVADVDLFNKLKIFCFDSIINNSCSVDFTLASELFKRGLLNAQSINK